MSFELLYDNVLIRETPRAEVTASGLYLAGGDRDSKVTDGIVIAAGPGVYVGEKFINTTVLPGFRVWFQLFQAFKIVIDNKEYFVVPERFIMGYEKR